MHYVGIYATIRLFYENNFMKEKCLCAMQLGFNMNIRCNQMFTLCKYRGIDCTGCADDMWDMRTQHFLGYPLYRPTQWGFPLYHRLDGKMSLSNALIVIKN